MTDEVETVDEGDDGATYTKADLSRVVQERLTKERAKFGDYAALKAKAARLDELEAANKTELEKANEARTAVERERDEARAEILRHRVAATKGLPVELAARLRGSTEEELAKDADELLKLVAPKAAPNTARPVPELRSGALPAGNTGQPFDGDAYIRAMARGK